MPLMNPGASAPQNSAGDADCLVDRDLGGNRVRMVELEEGDAKDGQVERSDAVDRPPLGEARNLRVD